MKTSILIPTFNYGRFIGAAIDSVLAQQADDFEIIVIDRQSADGTAEVLRSYTDLPNFHVVQQRGRGLANACNEGLAVASGRYILRLDADDLFCPGIMLIESLILDYNEELDFVYGDYFALVDDTGERIRKRLPAFDAVELMARGDFLCGGTMYRRGVFERFGGYDESLETLISYDFILRLMKGDARGYHVPVPLFAYRLHGASMSTESERIERTGRLIAERHGQAYTWNEHHPRTF